MGGSSEKVLIDGFSIVMRCSMQALALPLHCVVHGWSIVALRSSAFFLYKCTRRSIALNRQRRTRSSCARDRLTVTPRSMMGPDNSLRPRRQTYNPGRRIYGRVTREAQKLMAEAMTIIDGWRLATDIARKALISSRQREASKGYD